MKIICFESLQQETTKNPQVGTFSSPRYKTIFGGNLNFPLN